MKRAYIEELIHTAASDTDDYTYGERVEPGEVLVIRNLSVTWSDIATTEEAHFFVEDMGRKVFLGEDAAIDAGGHPHWSGEVALGEGDRAGVYCPDVAANDEVHFFILGELWDLDEWRKVKASE